jgi:putative heme-binding domain-containing protein
LQYNSVINMFRYFAIYVACGALCAPAQTKADLGIVSARFNNSCAVCHGMNGRGGRGGPDLVSGKWKHGGKDADLARVISQGVPGTEMPAFSIRHTPEQISALVAYIRSLASPSDAIEISGNVDKGRQIFWGKGGCSSCHMVTGRGGVLGPDLTDVGSQRSLATLKESIVSPSATIASGFKGVLVTKNGRTVKGVRKDEDNFTVQVFDGERHFSFQKSEATRVEQMKESLMPPSSLTAAEVNDVVVYLGTLGGKQ